MGRSKKNGWLGNENIPSVADDLTDGFSEEYHVWFHLDGSSRIRSVAGAQDKGGILRRYSDVLL